MYKTPGVSQTPGVFMTQLHDGVNFRKLKETVVECKTSVLQQSSSFALHRFFEHPMGKQIILDAIQGKQTELRGCRLSVAMGPP